MAEMFKYELWNGQECLGYFSTCFPLRGVHLVVPEVPEFKAKYRRKRKVISVPIINRVVSDNGVDLVLRKVLDVRRKSKRQIGLLKGRTIF